MTGQPGSQWYWFYCWRCEEWRRDEGPWCELYREAPLTSPCHFDEYPERRRGVPWWPPGEDPQEPPSGTE